MRPYYEQDGITIYHGDCREILPAITADVVLTDPPYGVNKDYGQYADSVIALGETVGAVLPMLRAITGRQLITCGIGNIWRYPPADWVLCWWKPNAMTRSKVANANIWEPILVYGCKGFGVDGVVATITPQPNGHPCPKPLKLFTWLLARASTATDVVLDPFVGSGTTLRAAKDLGRRAIGIEIEERYCEIAARRLDQTVLALGS